MLFKPRSFACVVSFGVITYLDSEEAVALLFSEMLRIAQDFVYVGEVSDLSKKQLAEHLRASSHVNSTSQQRHVSRSSPPHLYVSKDLFHRVAAEHGVTADIKDHTDPRRHAAFLSMCCEMICCRTQAVEARLNG